MKRRLIVAVVLLVAFPSAAHAQQPPAPATESAELAKKLSNPVSDLVSVPFQFNWEQNVGPSELTRFVLNIQPVLPFTLNRNWNMITRIIAPLLSQPPLTADARRHPESATSRRHSSSRRPGSRASSSGWAR